MLNECVKVVWCLFMCVGIYVKCFVVKEVFFKVVGIGFWCGVFMKDIGVVNVLLGVFMLVLVGGVKVVFDVLIFVGYEVCIYVMLIDDYLWV